MVPNPYFDFQSAGCKLIRQRKLESLEASVLQYLPDILALGLRRVLGLGA